MDIVTHTLMGAVVASAFAEGEPEAAAAFAFGAVAPDLDAFARVFGKRAFLRAHQTVSHALPVALAVGAGLFALQAALGWGLPWIGPALGLGMAFHALLDHTNTYGITLGFPFSQRRACREWVFFIDAVVIAATVAALGAVWLHHRATGSLGWAVQAGWGAAMLAYWVAKAALHGRARAASPAGTTSLLPSALVPWRFYGCARAGADRVRAFRVDALRGTVEDEADHAVLDASYLPVLEQVPEFRVMRSLSPLYHLVEAEPGPDGTRLVCRDLRTRNFDTRFGELRLVLDPAGAVRKVDLHV